MRLVPRDGLEQWQRVFEACENSHGLTGGGGESGRILSPRVAPHVYICNPVYLSPFLFGEKIKFFSLGPRPSLLYVPSAVLDLMTGLTVSSCKAGVLNQTRRNVL